jgi:phosphoadenosine phosphosulfate reductase
MPISEAEIALANQNLMNADPMDVLAWAGSVGHVAMTSSFGAQAAVLLHMANKAIPGLPVICVDTGYLPPETYLYIEELKRTLDLNLIVVNNNEWSPARMEAVYGKLWEKTDSDSHHLYGSMRKSVPLGDVLSAMEPSPTVLLSGLRRGQTKARANMPPVAMQDGRLKVLPMLNMSDQDVVDYYNEHELPQHPLVNQGYVSIGDWHSSRALQPGETAADARKTRFGGQFEECGLHVSAPQDAAGTLAEAVMGIIETTTVDQSTGIATHLVKKRLEDGDLCRKCKDVQNKLEKDDLLKHVGGVSIADLNEPTSAGLKIAEHFKEEKAPFFVVKEKGKDWRVIYSLGQWKKTVTKASQAQSQQ